MVSRSFQRRRKPSRRSRKRNALWKVFFFLLAFLLPLDLLTRPILDRAIILQGNRIAALVLSQEATALLKEMELTYSDLAQVERDTAGRVVSIESETAQINLIKSGLEQRVTERLSVIKQQDFSVPLGTLLNNPLLNGRGPMIRLHIAPVGVLHTQIVSNFVSAGINQTSHQIYLQLSLDFTAFIPLHKATSTIKTNILLAETVIVGEVPQYYTNVQSGENCSDSAWKDSALNPLLVGDTDKK